MLYGRTTILDMLESADPNQRFQACNELRAANSLSIDDIQALRKATGDLDPEVAAAARKALDAHRFSYSASYLDPFPTLEVENNTGQSEQLEAENHADMIQLLNVAFLLIGLPLICVVGQLFSSLEWGGGAVILLGAATGILIYHLLWSRPVHCQTPGCNGLMEKTRSQISGMKDELRYRCPICNSVYVREIFQMHGEDKV